MAFRVRRGRGLDLKDVCFSLSFIAPRSQQAWHRQQQILPGHPSSGFQHVPTITKYTLPTLLWYIGLPHLWIMGVHMLWVHEWHMVRTVDVLDKIWLIDNLSLKYVIYLYMYNLLRAFSFSHRLVAHVILFCLSVPPFCDMCICSSRTKGEGRHCSGTIPGIDLFAEVTKTSLTSSRFSVWARLGSPQSMRHDIIIIFCWWTSNDIKCMIMRVCHVSPTCFFGNIILETMNIIWTSWTLTTCMCKSQRDWSKWRSGSVYRCSNSRSSDLQQAEAPRAQSAPRPPWPKAVRRRAPRCDGLKWPQKRLIA